MNVAQYFQQKLGVSPTDDLMGDDIPLDSSCGHACESCIDAAAALFEEFDQGIDVEDGVAKYAFIGHIYSAFGATDYGHMQQFQHDPDTVNIVKICQAVCECYIYG